MSETQKQTEIFLRIFSRAFNLILGGVGSGAGWYFLTHLEVIGINPALAICAGVFFSHLSYEWARLIYYRSRQGKPAAGLGYGAVEEIGITMNNAAIIGFVNLAFLMIIFWGIELGFVR